MADVRDDWRMLIHESDTHLRSMLAAGGVNLRAVTTSDLPAFLVVFQRFATIPVDDASPVEEDGDALLAQFGTFEFRGTPEFSVDLTRQLIEDSDDDGAIWQLSCTFYWASTLETEALDRGDLWSFGMAADEFFPAVHAMPGWSWALGGAQPPRNVVIELEEV